MAGKASVGALNIAKVSVGGTEVKKVAVGSTEVWSGVEEMTEEWSTIDPALWVSTYDPGGSSQYLYADGALRAPAVSGWNIRNIALVVSRKRYPTPYGRWAVQMTSATNSGLATFILLSSDAQASACISLQMTSSTAGFIYRTSASNTAQVLSSINSGYSANAWVIVERTEDSLYRASFNGGASWPLTYQDDARLGESASMGYIGNGITSDINFFSTRGYGGPIDRFRYTNDPTANITA